MTKAIEARDLYRRHYESSRRQAGRGPGWLAALREQAIEQFGREGLPTTRDEDWRFTSLAALTDLALRPATAPASLDAARTLVEQVGVPSLAGPELVFVNGVFTPELSRTAGVPAGVRAGSLAALFVEDPGLASEYVHQQVRFEQLGFTSLNTAFLADGAAIVVPRGRRLEAPIHVLFLSTADQPAVSHPRVLVVAGEGCELQVIESYAGAEGQVYLTNAVTEFRCEPGAVVDHYKVQRESLAAFHVSSTHVLMARAANFVSHSLTLGGGFVRNDVNAVLDAEGIECTLNGLYLARGRQLVDNHTAIDHAMPHCASHELYKGVLDGAGRGVFNGKIFVRQDAQKTDAKQTNQVLLLSDDATINTKPQLEIFADDVKCTHGATVGQLDREAMFYLRARGIHREDARAMLIHAFAEDIIDRIRIEPLKEELERLLLERLPVSAT